MCTNSTDVFICDESDFLLEQHTVHFKDVIVMKSARLTGLAAIFFSKKTYFMSATFDDYQKKLFGQIYPQVEKVLTFHNLHTFLTGADKEDFQIASVIKDSAEQLYDAVLSKVQESFDEQPFIVFMAEHNASLFDGL